MMIRHEFTFVLKLDHELMHFLWRVLALKGGMTAEEVQEAKDRLTATAAKLHDLGTDPATPG